MPQQPLSRKRKVVERGSPQVANALRHTSADRSARPIAPCFTIFAESAQRTPFLDSYSDSN